MQPINFQDFRTERDLRAKALKRPFSFLTCHTGYKSKVFPVTAIYDQKMCRWVYRWNLSPESFFMLAKGVSL